MFLLDENFDDFCQQALLPLTHESHLRAGQIIFRGTGTDRSLSTDLFQLVEFGRS